MRTPGCVYFEQSTKLKGSGKLRSLVQTLIIHERVKLFPQNFAASKRRSACVRLSPCASAGSRAFHSHKHWHLGAVGCRGEATGMLWSSLELLLSALSVPVGSQGASSGTVVGLAASLGLQEKHPGAKTPRGDAQPRPAQARAAGGGCWPTAEDAQCLLPRHQQTGEGATRAVSPNDSLFSLSLTNEPELQKQFSLGINIQIPTAQAEALNELSRGRLR